MLARKEAVLAEYPNPTIETRERTRTKVLAGIAVSCLTLTSCQSEFTPKVEASSPPVSSTLRTGAPSAPAQELPSRLPSLDLPTLPEIDLDINSMTDLAECAPYLKMKELRNREYEVCVAYIGNSASVALQAMYKYGNNRVNYLADGARSHFETRYWEQPRDKIERQVDSWPKTFRLAGNKVEQDINLKGLMSQLAENRAFIWTSESWKVTAQDGTVLSDEALHDVRTTMCHVRLPGHPLHEWVVAANGPEPQAIDCREFADRNGLEQ